jgi:hypothetical protein
LDIDPAGFTVPAEGKVNASVAPRFRRAYRAATKANAWLYRRGLFRVSKWLKDRGAKRLFEFNQGYRFPPLADEDRLKIEEIMEPDTQAVEALTQLDLSSWRKARSS